MLFGVVVCVVLEGLVDELVVVLFGVVVCVVLEELEDELLTGFGYP